MWPTETKKDGDKMRNEHYGDLGSITDLRIFPEVENDAALRQQCAADIMASVGIGNALGAAVLADPVAVALILNRR